MSDIAGGETSQPVLRFKNSQLVLDAKFWWAVGLGALLVGVGIATTPTNGWAGLGIGLGGIVGAVLGALLQTAPVPRSFTAEGAAAVRGLLTIARDIEIAQSLTTQLAQADGADERIKLGLVDVQNRLIDVRTLMYVSMSEWENVAPGALKEIERLREAGRDALQRLSEEAERDQAIER